MESKKKITFNALGTKYQITMEMFEKCEKESRLGKLYKFRELDKKQILDYCDDYTESTHEFFFNRDPAGLRMVLNYLITGELHLNEKMCAVFVENELKYWLFDSKTIKRCCKTDYTESLSDRLQKIEIEQKIEKDLSNEKIVSTTREKIDDILNKPVISSILSMVYLSINIFILIMWHVYYLYSTLPDVRGLILNTNGSAKAHSSSHIKVTSYELNQIFFILELVFFLYFGIELLIRFIISTQKLKWLKNGFNIIDFISILLFFIFLIVRSVYTSSVAILYFKRGAELLKVISLLKLTNISWRARLVGLAIKRSYKELLMSTYVIVMSLLLVSAVMFFMESSANEAFDSIPAVFWWSMVTMTTVGYGDMYPVTIQGKLVASFVFLWGIVVISLPIAIIGSNFVDAYSEAKYKNDITEEYEKKHTTKVNCYEIENNNQQIVS